MTGALLGLLLGVGLLLIWRSGSRAPQRRADRRGPGRREQLLAAAGLTGINAAQLLALQIGLGLLALVVVLLTTSTVTVSLGGRAAVRRRLDALGAESSVEDFRIEQVVWGGLGLLGAAVLATAGSLLAGSLNVLSAAL